MGCIHRYRRQDAGRLNCDREKRTLAKFNDPARCPRRGWTPGRRQPEQGTRAPRTSAEWRRSRSPLPPRSGEHFHSAAGARGDGGSNGRQCAVETLPTLQGPYGAGGTPSRRSPPPQQASGSSPVDPRERLYGYSCWTTCDCTTGAQPVPHRRSVSQRLIRKYYMRLN